MHTGMETIGGGVKQTHLLAEVMETSRLASAMRQKLWDIFLKQESPDLKSPDAASPSNPIDHAIQLSQDTQQTIKQCLELLEVEVINKLVGK